MHNHTVAIAIAIALAFAPAGCSSTPDGTKNDSSSARESSTPASAASAEPTSLPAPPDVAAVPADAERTPSGLASKVIKPGSGEQRPGPEDTVIVHYTGWTTDGRMFDSSVVRGQPARFPLNRVIKGWTEGVQLMRVGEQRRFWIPSELAYGDKPQRPGAPAGMLVFDVELQGITPAPKPIAAPVDVAAPPRDAKRTPSGLAFKVLQKGSGSKHPGPRDSVEVHYTGWTTDGRMFDSSVVRGQPIVLPLDGVIKGWTEGLQLMVEGEKRRFWIPGPLAYGDKPQRPGAPAGMLVFDVELLKIR